MKYIELTVYTTTEASELIADVMWDYSCGGVSVCDVNDVIAIQKDTSVYWDYIDDSLTGNARKDVLVKCYLNVENAAEEIRAIRRAIEERKRLAAGAIPFGTLEETRREIEGDDWIDVWKKHFRPLHIGERIVVVPAWIAYTPKEGEAVVTLDSNMAFGTGEHETTSMCLELLQQTMRAGDIVIDVGCGSGILGIAAAKLGAQRCYLTDIDLVAVDSARHNAEENGVAERTVVAHSDLLADASIKGDVVLANITAEILIRLAPDVHKNMKDDGTLILSGIIEDRLPLVEQAFAAQGLALQQEMNRGEWYALVYRRA